MLGRARSLIGLMIALSIITALAVGVSSQDACVQIVERINTKLAAIKASEKTARDLYKNEHEPCNKVDRARREAIVLKQELLPMRQRAAEVCGNRMPAGLSLEEIRAEIQEATEHADHMFKSCAKREARSEGPCRDEAQCTFRVKNFKGHYPNEKERSCWDCYDRNTKKTIGCSFIRGQDIELYSDIFQRHGNVYGSCSGGGTAKTYGACHAECMSKSQYENSHYCSIGCKHLPK